MSNPVPITQVQDLYRSLAETHSGQNLEDAFTEVLEGIFDQATSHVRGYVVGPEISKKRDDHALFDVMSLGNWLTIALQADIPFIPARLLGAPRSLALFSDGMGNPRPDHFRDELEDLDEAIQSIADNEMLRFDHCGSGALKSRISKGQPEIAGDARGVIKGHNGQLDHILCERLVESFLNSMSDYMPVWARPIVKPRVQPGWDFHTGHSGMWPCEWRVYVREGRVTGASNYYPQSAASEEDLKYAKVAVSCTQKMIDVMAGLNISPHHPRYVAEFEPKTASFSADFICAENGEVLFLEGGPAHIYNPPFGASPCCFNPHDGIDGVALAQGKILPLDCLES